MWKQGITASIWHIACSVWPTSFGDKAHRAGVFNLFGAKVYFLICHLAEVYQPKFDHNTRSELQELNYCKFWVGTPPIYWTLPYTLTTHSSTRCLFFLYCFCTALCTVLYCTVCTVKYRYYCPVLQFSIKQITMSCFFLCALCTLY